MAKYYEEGSLAELGAMGFEKIKKLSQSQKITDKLMGVNGLLVAFIISVLLTNYFFPNGEFFIFIIGLVFFFLLSIGGMIGYIPLLETLVNFTENKISSLKFSIYLLFLAMAFTLIGIYSKLILVNYIAYFFLGSQLAIIPFGFILPKSGIKNREIKLKDLWDVLGKVGIVLGIISSLITIITLMLKFI